MHEFTEAPGIDDQVPGSHSTQLEREVIPSAVDQVPMRHSMQRVEEKIPAVDDQVPAGQVMHIALADAPS